MKPENVNEVPSVGTAEAQPSSAPSSGSARGIELPKDMLRLVVQIEDTEPNRIALEAAFKMIQKIPFPTQTHSVLKLEQIRIASMKRLVPNDQAER